MNGQTLPQYNIRLRVRNPWWRLFFPIEMYEVEETYKYWDDPTYGHGGGSWELGTRVIRRFLSFDKAETLCRNLRILNKGEGQ